MSEESSKDNDSDPISESLSALFNPTDALDHVLGWDMVRSTLINSIKELLTSIAEVPIEDFTMDGKIEVSAELIVLLKLTRSLHRMVVDSDDDEDDDEDDSD